MRCRRADGEFPGTTLDHVAAADVTRGLPTREFRWYKDIVGADSGLLPEESEEEKNYKPTDTRVPKELLLEDFRQQCTNLQGQYTRMHNRMQLLVGLSTVLLPALGTAALAAGKGDVGRPWLILFPLAGLLLSAIGFITGSADRKLVTIYRDQLSWTAKCVLSAHTEGSFEDLLWLHIGRDPTGVDKDLKNWRERPRPQEEPWWDQVLSWRWEPLSVTRLPAVLSLAFIVIWLVLLVVLLVNV